MTESALYKRFNKYEAAFCKHYNKTSQKIKVERIHKLRVDVKRIRAIFKLLEFTSSEQCDIKVQLNTLSQLFDVAGHLREVQVNILQVNHSEDSEITLYEQHLEKKESKAVKKLKKQLKHFDLNQFLARNKRIKISIEKIGEQTVFDKSEEFIASKTREIKKLQSDLTNHKRLHKIRIHLKAMGAIAQLLNDLQPKSTYKKLSDSIKALGLMIGDWHDKQVLISSLKKYAVKSGGGDDTIERFIGTITRESDELAINFEEELNIVFPG